VFLSSTLCFFNIKIKSDSFTTAEIITTVTWHPTDLNCVAVGDKLGKITLYYDFLNDQEPTLSVYHWHSHPVNCIEFTSDGVYLLSGGLESVLVLWQISTRTKQFLPHLGSDILSISISPDQLHFLLHLKENCLKLISSVNLEVEHILRSLTCAQADLKKFPLSAGLTIEPLRQNIVLNGYPGTIQFYNVLTDTHIREVEVMPRNRVAFVESKEVKAPRVQKLCFSENGDWMVTVSFLF
jgi:NET1-associated nuclear protein 1 (U3 small nucleolar RNA-associated protein 17)